jgi:hypothetical protein
MDPYIHLYQFTRAGNPMSLATISHVRIRPGPGPAEETVEVAVDITETLWREPPLKPPNYAFQRPSSLAGQTKFSDPVWGRVRLQQGAKIMIIFANSGTSSNSSVVYVDQIADAGDPILDSIRSILDSERSLKDRNARFDKLFARLHGGIVEKLYAGEALAKDSHFRPEEEVRIGEALPRAFAEEKDEYVKISLGSWLWDLVYPRAGVAGRVNTLKATIQAAGSASENVRTFALDRLAQAEPTGLREAGVKASPDVVRLLEDRHAKEDDAGVRHHLEQIIAVLRR